MNRHERAQREARLASQGGMVPITHVAAMLEFISEDLGRRGVHSGPADGCVIEGAAAEALRLEWLGRRFVIVIAPAIEEDGQ
jgi:hypothetical protein